MENPWKSIRTTVQHGISMTPSKGPAAFSAFVGPEDGWLGQGSPNVHVLKKVDWVPSHIIIVEPLGYYRQR